MLNKQHRVWLIAALMIVTLACSAPGFSAPPDSGPLDTDALSTIVAGTANAAATQTALVATNTPPPSSIETAAPTETATPTPRVSAEGTSLSKQSDGSFIFTDQQGGYSVVVPSGWLVVRINEQEFLDAWGLPEASDPKLQNFLTQFQKADPKVYRLVGADITPEHFQGSFLTNFSISWNRNSTLTLQQEIDQTRKYLPQSIKGAKITYADVGTTSTQIPMAILEISWSTKDTSGQTIKIYQKIIGFKLKNGTLAFTLTTTPDLKDALINSFDFMTDQIMIFP